jgi:hypothetical protein
MVEAMILLDANGPLPLKTTFQAPADGSVMFGLSGTAYTSLQPTVIGITLALDGVIVGKPATCFATTSYAIQTPAHWSVRTTFFAVNNLTPGEHTITVAAKDYGTMTDQNDTFQVTLFY